MIKKLEIEAKNENLGKVMSFIESELENADCPMKTQMQISLAIEEIFVNISQYAYVPETGIAVISVSVGNEAVITFEDSGKPYNPLEKEDPDITAEAQDREIGGLGIFMVKKTMDNMTCERKDGKNILTITKAL